MIMNKREFRLCTAGNNHVHFGGAQQHVKHVKVPVVASVSWQCRPPAWIAARTNVFAFFKERFLADISPPFQSPLGYPVGSRLLVPLLLSQISSFIEPVRAISFIVATLALVKAAATLAATAAATHPSFTVYATPSGMLASSPPAIVSQVSLCSFFTVATTSVVSFVHDPPIVSSFPHRSTLLSAASAVALTSAAPVHSH